MQNTFYQLDHVLTEYADIWRTSPFVTPKPAWLNQYPTLHDWLMTLTDSEVDHLQGDDNFLCQQIAPYLPVAQKIYSLIQLPLCEQKVPYKRSYDWQRDVPGRKVEQIEAFSAATGEVLDPLLEWCSGKLHLGRYLAEQFNVPVLGLDINHRLVKQANQLAQRMNIDARAVPCDVLTEAAKQNLNNQQHAIALHACGGLHVSLLEGCVEKQVKRITLSPCCYHRFSKTDNYQPLSNIAKQSKLRFDCDDLRSAVRQSNTAPERERANRKRLQVWRLGFDLLQRDVRGIDEYMSVPSMPVELLKGSFTNFCHYVSNIKGLSLPSKVNFSAYEEQGEKRFFEYSRFELARMAFRRALECWLALDRVMYLEDHGYECSLSQFCLPSLTPRNLLIDAVKLTLDAKSSKTTEWKS